MTGPTRHTDPSQRPRKDRMYEPHVSDPYRAREKWPEPTRCPECQAIFHQGRWQWGETAASAEQHICPACQRIRDGIPAGQLSLSGGFFAEHRAEILNLIRKTEAAARAEHPLERLMAIQEEQGQTVASFTDTHLTHSVGEALRHAYHGELDSRYIDEDTLLRISWSR